MKNLILLFVINLTCTVAFAQEYFIPQSLHNSNYSEKYPIGWSAEGDFAYVELGNYGDLCGFCPYYKFTIETTNSEERVELEVDAWTDKWEGNLLPFNEYWARNKDEISRYLVKHNIQQYSDFRTDINRSGIQKYSLVTDKEEVTKPYPEGGSYTITKIKSAEVFLFHNEYGQKLVYSHPKFEGSELGDISVIETVYNKEAGWISFFIRLGFLPKYEQYYTMEHSERIEIKVITTSFDKGFQSGESIQFDDYNLMDDELLGFILVGWMNPVSEDENVPMNLYFSNEEGINYIVFNTGCEDTSQKFEVNKIEIEENEVIMWSQDKKFRFRVYRGEGVNGLAVSGYINTVYKDGFM
jgi:hypothetical protein